MARLGRGRPVRGVTILGPGPGYAPPPAGPVASFVSSRRDLPPTRRDVPRRSVQVLGPKIVGTTPLEPVAKLVFARVPRPPRLRVTQPRPKGFLHRTPAPEVCRMDFRLTVRANLNFELEVLDTVMGRTPLDFVIVNCRNEV